jgi:F0F1-type ATP synthase membrane subunit b/b'
MATANTPADPATSATLKAYEDKVAAQIKEAKAKLEQYEAKATEQRTQAELKAIEQLKMSRQNLEQKVRGLKTTQEGTMERTKAEINAEVARLHTSIDDLTNQYRASIKK